MNDFFTHSQWKFMVGYLADRQGNVRYNIVTVMTVIQ